MQKGGHGTFTWFAPNGSVYRATGELVVVEGRCEVVLDEHDASVKRGEAKAETAVNYPMDNGFVIWHLGALEEA